MDRHASPLSNPDSMANSSPPSPVGDEAGGYPAGVARKKKVSRKKRKATTPTADDLEAALGMEHQPVIRKHKKPKQRRKQEKLAAAAAASEEEVPPRNSGNKKNRNKARRAAAVAQTQVRDDAMSAAQVAVNEQMRRALEEDQYSANGSIVHTDSEDDESQHMYKGQPIRLDRNFLLTAARKHLWLERVGGSVPVGGALPTDGDNGDARRVNRKKKKKGKRNKEEERGSGASSRSRDIGGLLDDKDANAELELDESSIFGQTTGSSNSTWVECDKCKKWRRLRGVVDEKKLPTKWYCSMNKNDPERARCSAPEEEYDASHTPESAADARTRKHLRVWVRRLQCNEAYENRQPTQTRGKKRAVSSGAKEPYEWVRCCNPSCGKWRTILRIMDAKSNVIDRAADGEWYCVMNTWDEKMASCAAPQENLPAVGCPPWVLQNDS